MKNVTETFMRFNSYKKAYKKKLTLFSLDRKKL